ncbi:rRNA-processing protein las1 [Tulasnella sp. 332]|nr:rRNA-processing protein las1 [Tulasnella sp. 332]
MAIQFYLEQLCAWRSNTTIPHALEATISLLSVILDDNSTDAPSSNMFSLRQAYALAVVRFVNNLVDPLQQGTFARPITSIAAQIGLPAWFVELRHQSTHEELPSLVVLREAAKQALAWLLRNYFIPTIHPTPSVEVQPTMVLPSFAPLLQEYKALMKLQANDSSLIHRQRDNLNRILRNMERWINETKLALRGSFGFQGIDEGNNVEEQSEGLALDYLCDNMLVKGGLFRVSKK